MADEYVIARADLTYIERALNTVNENILGVGQDVGTVDNHLRETYSEIEALAREFHDFVNIQIRSNNKQSAQTDLVRVRQELKDKYGHYDEVRRNAVGILQADDLGIVRGETIANVSEELMLSAPGYWLAPCLVAMAAWIRDQKDLAEKAVREALKRDDEKTSLFFTLVCRRAERKEAALKWAQRYLANQDEENLDRTTIIILDAYASGLLGADSEGLIWQQMSDWLGKLASKPGFVDQQTAQWSEAINLKRRSYPDDRYQYLVKYSPTWPQLKDVMEGAALHAELLEYFTAIFEQEASTATLKTQLDDILTSLVTDFDEEELPLRREEKLDQLIIQFEGDKTRAQKDMDIEQTAFDTRKDFTQLLTDASMKPESSHASVSTQKFAIALSKTWITDAYNDVVARNRMKIPGQIEIRVDTFSGMTTDGSNEPELINSFNTLIDQEKAAELEKYRFTAFDKFCLYGGIGLAVIGILFIILGIADVLGAGIAVGVIGLFAGIGMVLYHFSKKSKVEKTRAQIETNYEAKRTTGSEIIRASLAEVVDFRAEFAYRDAESAKVLDFLAQISPEQYVKKLADSGRKVIMS